MHSDRFIEQGNQATSALPMSGATAKFNLTKPFSNTSYSLVVSEVRPAGYRDNFLAGIRVSKSQIQIWSNWAGSANKSVDGYGLWVTSGY